MAKRRAEVVDSKVIDRRQISERGNRRVVTFELKLDDGSTVTREVSMRGNEEYTSKPPTYVLVDEPPPGVVQRRALPPPPPDLPPPNSTPARPDPKYKAMLDAQRTQLQRVAEHRGAERVKSLYDATQDALESKLRRTLPGRKDTMTAHVQRLMLAQTRQGQMLLANRMMGELGDLTEQAQVESLRGLSSSLTKMEKQFHGVDVSLPLEEASIFWGIVDNRQRSIMRQMETTVARLGARVMGEVEKGLALSMMTGETTDEAIDRARKITGEQWYQAERIVRTEQAYAYNAAHTDGIAEVQKEVDDLFMRWVEHVTDTGKPMDTRVGPDSIAMHGQVARPGALFTMPFDPDVSPSLIGESWEFPPNRPNDRAVVTAWRPSWGGLAWVYEGGRKRYLSR